MELHKFSYFSEMRKICIAEIEHGNTVTENASLYVHHDIITIRVSGTHCAQPFKGVCLIHFNAQPFSRINDALQCF
jgi:hypothetical protein